MRGSPFGFTNFSRGLNVLDSPYTLQDGEAREVLNMVSSPRGAIRKRYGWEALGQLWYGRFPSTIVDAFTRVDENPLNNAGKWVSVGSHERPKLVNKKVEANG